MLDTLYADTAAQSLLSLATRNILAGILAYIVNTGCKASMYKVASSSHNTSWPGARAFGNISDGGQAISKNRATAVSKPIRGYVVLKGCMLRESRQIYSKGI